jgi:LysR family nitrogen assimilation transcriptional regulator
MDFKQLQNFIHIAETGSLTRAAQLVGLTQAALSRQVTQLEAELQTELFSRNGSKGLALTASGKLLLEHALVIVGQVGRAQRAVMRGGTGNVEGHLAVGLPPSLSRTIAVPLLEAVREQMPRSTMTTVEGLSFALLDLLGNGRLDCAVIYNRGVVSTHRVELTPLRQEDIYLVAAAHGKGLDAAYTGSIPLAALGDLPLISAGRFDAVHTSLLSGLTALGRSTTVVHEIANLAAIFDMVRLGYGVAVAPLSAVRSYVHDPELRLYRIVEPSLRCTLSIATPVRTQPDALILNAIKILRDVTEAQIAGFHDEVEAAIEARFGGA